MTTAILDYGMGNTGSMRNMFSRLGVECLVTSNPEDLRASARIVLPGVGAFDQAILRLRDLGVIDVLEERVLGAGVPFLGVCLGMQLLTRASEEGTLPGLGWIDADTHRFESRRIAGDLPVPHMGWNHVESTEGDGLFASQPPDPRFYFAHSYYIECDSEETVAATTRYGDFRFASAVRNGNVMGVQFHPEKSHLFGMRLLEAFAAL